MAHISATKAAGAGGVTRGYVRFGAEGWIGGLARGMENGKEQV